MLTRSRIQSDPRGWGLVSSVDPLQATASSTIGGANRTGYFRIIGAGRITKVGISVITASGNVCVSAYRNTGRGRAARPGQRLATSGSVPCPAVGYSEIALDQAAVLRPGDWLAIGNDDNLASLRCCGTTILPSGEYAGRSGYEAVYPPPATAGTLTVAHAKGYLLIGVS